jgi:hypothetical protein
MTKDELGFHTHHGLYFKRQPDGGVLVTWNDDSLRLDPQTWASVIAAVSPKGDTAETFSAAQHFHLEPEDAEWMNAPLGPYKEANPLAMLEALAKKARGGELYFGSFYAYFGLKGEVAFMQKSSGLRGHSISRDEAAALLEAP